MSTQKINFLVSGMNCSACAARLEKSLLKSDSVVSASVNFALENATLEISKDTPFHKIFALVKKTGFEVVSETHQLALPKSISLPERKSLEDAIRKTQGVIEISFPTTSASVSVVGITKVINRQLLIDIAHRAGINLGSVSTQDNKVDTPQKPMDLEFWKVVLAIILSLPFFLMMVFTHWGFMGWGDFWIPPIIQGILSTFILLVLGGSFFKGSYYSLKDKSANMEVLVVLGSSAACIFSWYQLILSDQAQIYFETTAFIITLVLVGKYLENRTKSRVADAITDLMALRPEMATMVLEGGETKTLPATEIQVGDVLLCQAGQKIPVDGVVIKGSAEVDEAMISGESLPVLKNKGTKVIAGSINCDGLIYIEAQAVGEEATLSRLIKLIEEAHSRKAKIYPLVDRISSIFVPVVFLIAMLSFGFWLALGEEFEKSLIYGVSVLVIACPCALGLATPTAIMAGTSLAARNGILIRDNETLQKARSLTHLVFDKTGTLTTGQPKVEKIIPVSSEYNSTGLVAIAASLQQGSEHPIARAIKAEAQDLNCSLEAVDNFRNHVGLGVEGELSGRRYLLGSSNLFKKIGWELDLTQFGDQEPQVILGRHEENGKTLLGGMSIQDEARPQSSGGIKLLKDEGLKVMILSGDKESAVQRIAKITGITSYVGNADPVAKITEIKKLVKQGHIVGMVGDGINDSPALAHAHVGFAMGSGTDVAMSSSGIILMRSDPRLVSNAIAISRITFRKIKQNLFWAFIYNVIALPLAAFGFLNPAVAAGAMAMSSLSVVTNSLLLKFWKARV